jgi:hypothetical protein
MHSDSDQEQRLRVATASVPILDVEALLAENQRLRDALQGIADDRTRTVAGLQGWAREALRGGEDVTGEQHADTVRRDAEKRVYGELEALQDLVESDALDKDELRAAAWVLIERVDGLRDDLRRHERARGKWQAENQRLRDALERIADEAWKYWRHP